MGLTAPPGTIIRIYLHPINMSASASRGLLLGHFIVIICSYVDAEKSN